MKRIYHHYLKWECYKNEMYLTKDINELKNINIVLDFFRNDNLFLDTGIEFIDKWKFTLQHHLSDDSINKIAYIGQLACNYKYKIPEITTKKAWYLLDENTQIKANRTAKLIIYKYLNNEQENKQLSLFVE